MGTKKLNQEKSAKIKKNKIKQNSILKEDSKLTVKEWERDIVVKCDQTSEYISPEELERTTFSREKH